MFWVYNEGFTLQLSLLQAWTFSYEVVLPVVIREKQKNLAVGLLLLFLLLLLLLYKGTRHCFEKY